MPQYILYKMHRENYLILYKMYIDILVQDAIIVLSNKTKHLDNLTGFTLFGTSAIIITIYKKQ